MTGKLTLDFENLPLFEAAVRVSFNTSMPLRFSLVQSIHEALKSSFPTLSEAQQHEIAPGMGETQVEISTGSLPGAVYEGNKCGLSVHVQPQVVVARWSRRPGFDDIAYPRYAVLRDSLWHAVEAFEKASGDDFPGIAVVNMSYVNFIAVSDPTSVPTRYFAEDATLSLMDGARQVRKLEGAWSEADELDVRFVIEQAGVKLPEGPKEGYRLTTAAGLRLGETQDPGYGLEKVHDRLQTFFLQLISDEAQREWGLRERQE